MKNNLQITYLQLSLPFRKAETFKNIKTLEGAMEIVRKRMNIKLATYKEQIIYADGEILPNANLFKNEV